MVTLIVDNSQSILENLNSEQFKALKSILSYSIDPKEQHYRGSWKNPIRYLIDKRGVFGTGLLYLVEKFLKENHISHKIMDRRLRPIPQNLFSGNFSYVPYKEQRDAAIACKIHNRGIIVAPTGIGKSLIAALIIHELQVPTLLVVPSIELKKQLTYTMAQIFGNAKVGDRYARKNICVENVDALDYKKPITGYDCVIVDEFHHSGAKTYRKLNAYAWNNIYYKFGLTATPFRSKDNEQLLLESVLSKIIYEVEYDIAVSNDYIVPLEAYYIESPQIEMEGNSTSWHAVNKELVINNVTKNEIIASMLKKLELTGESALCLVKEIQHGEILSKMTGVAFACGEKDNNRQLILEFALGERKLLIGTTGVLGEGVDTKPAEYIILGVPVKSRNLFMQMVGRGFRTHPGKTSCKLILFKDLSHKFLLNHFKEQVKILKEEYNVKPVKLSIDD